MLRSGEKTMFSLATAMSSAAVSHTAELCGLVLALCAVEGLQKQKRRRGIGDQTYHIKTDSQSALLSLDKPGLDCELEGEIAKRAVSLSGSGANLIFS